MTIEEIIQGCWLGGCTLEQWLATNDGYWDNPKIMAQVKLVNEHLARPQAERDAIFLRAVRR